MRKSLIKWFEQIPEPYQTQAINNTPKHRVGNETSSMSGALMVAFEWGKTTEGFEYWNDIHTKIQLGETRETDLKFKIKQIWV